MEKNRPQQSPYDRAKSDAKSSANVAFFVVILWALFVSVTVVGWLPEQRIGVDGLLVGSALAYMALIIAKSGMNIAVLQMEQAREQAEDQRLTDRALADAISKLTEELRHRPVGSSSLVTFSLFGSSSLIRPVPEAPSGKG